jgi:signal transduction histidine kinase/ActR/RegA family two-component response regulator
VSYPIAVLVLGFVAAFAGVQSLFLLYLTRRRIHLWVGALGLASAGYAHASHGLYSTTSVVVGGQWQVWQFFFAGIMVAAAVLIGLEYLGRVRRAVMLAVTAQLLVLEVLLFVPGLGVSDRPAVKQVAWLGVTYHEMDVGLAPVLFVLVGFLWMGYVAVLLVRRARRGDRRDRVMATVQVLWFLAGTSDFLVTLGVYPFVYLAEYGFVLIVLVAGVVLVEAQVQRGVDAERQRLQLAREVLAKDRDLALAQAELTEAAKLAAVGRLAAGVAHEINNPLAYVMGNLQILKHELAHDDELGQLAVEALDGAGRIHRVVGQLSSFASRGEAMGPGSVANAVESASRMASAELKDRARVELELQPELPPVALDEGKLAQVLLNLLINAAQSIPAGDRDHNLVRVRARQLEVGLVELAVEDSGSGIGEEALPHLFEPFFTTKAPGQGVGLGLAISRELVTRAGGRIAAENLARGARFTVVLPALAEPSTTRPARPPSGGIPLQARGQLPRLLLVDDESEVLISLGRVLGRRFRVETAASGREALERINQAAGDYHAVVCDLMMPDGSGLDVFEAIKQRWPSLVPRLVLMTGGPLGPEREALDARRAELRLLEKPFRVDELVSLIEQPLAQRER